MEILVRPYFSYSQMAAFLYSRSRFLENYYYGKEQESVYLDLGKRLGTALQFRNIPEIPEIEKIRRQIPVAKIHEQELKTIFKKIPLLCYLDGWNPDVFHLQEYKTGKAPSEASWKKQMLFYSLALYLLHKRLPERITLHWCRTFFNDNDQLQLSGEVKTYDIKITMQEVIAFSAEIVKTYEEIKRLCEHEYQMYGILPVQRSDHREKKLCKICKDSVLDKELDICGNCIILRETNKKNKPKK